MLMLTLLVTYGFTWSSLAHGRSRKLDCTYRNKISRDYGEVVVVDRHVEVVVDTSVDEPQAMLFALLERSDMVLATRRALHHTIDQGSIWNRWTCYTVKRAHVEGESGIVEPIGQCHWAQISVVVRRGWPVDDDSAHDSISVLRGEVRVVPRNQSVECSQISRPTLAEHTKKFHAV